MTVKLEPGAHLHQTVDVIDLTNDESEDSMCIDNEIAAHVD